jgi:hypothetical protein
VETGFGSHWESEVEKIKSYFKQSSTPSQLSLELFSEMTPRVVAFYGFATHEPCHGSIHNELSTPQNTMHASALGSRNPEKISSEIGRSPFPIG